jgi:hypothetical protein
MDDIEVSKSINASPKFVYKWCTDFSEDDPKITGSSSVRKVLEKTKKRAIYVVDYEGADGTRKFNVNIVSLVPQKNAWHLDQFGEEDNETGDYKVKGLGKNKTRLDMVFREKWKNIAKIPSIEEQVKQTNEVWDKYVAALEKDYSDSFH